MSEIKFEPWRPTPPTNEIGLDKNDPTFLDTFRANTTQYFQNAISDTIQEAKGLPAPDLDFDIEEFIKETGVDPFGTVARQLRSRAINKSEAERIFWNATKNLKSQEVLEKSGFVKSMIADPLFLFELSSLGALNKGAKFFGKQALAREARSGPDPYFGPLITAKINETYAKKGFRLANLETAFYFGTPNALTFADALAQGEDAEKATIDAVTNQLLAQGFASIVGGGIGKAVDIRNRKAFNDAFRHAQEVHQSSKKPIDTTPVTPKPAPETDAVPTSTDEPTIEPKPISPELQKNYDAERANSNKFDERYAVQKALLDEKAELDEIIADSDLETAKKLAKEQKPRREEIQREVDAIQKELDELGLENQRIMQERDALSLKATITAEPLPEVEAGELDFMGTWFTDSIFYKSLPTPVKSVMNSDAPDEVKLMFMRLINDGGVGFKMNQAGKVFGRSVAQESGELAGKWGETYQELHSIWSEVNPRGGAAPLDMPIQNTIEYLRKVTGKDSLTFEDFGKHVVDLYINQKTPKTEYEARALKVVREYFDQWDQALNDVGLLNNQSALLSRAQKIEGRITSIDNVITDIIKSNRDFLETQVTKKLDKIDDLEAKFKSKGLTKNQQDLLTKLRAERDAYSTALEASYNIRNSSDVLNYVNNIKASVKQEKALTNLVNHLDNMKARYDNLQSYLDGSAVEKGLREPFFPRYFNRQYIAKNRDKFVSVLTKEYQENPLVWKWDNKTKRYVQVRLDTDYQSAKLRAEQTADEILDMVDDDGFNDEYAYFGAGKSKHLLHRKLDISNSKLQEFMITDLKQVLIAYNSKVAPKYAFAKAFRNPDTGGPASIEDVIDDITKKMEKAGLSQDQINMVNKEFNASYDRIVGRVLTQPDTINTRIAQWLQTATQWTYLGGAGVAAISDFANVFMDNELRTIGKGMLSLMDDNSIKMSRGELLKSGDGFEIIGGTYSMKFMESLSSDPFRNGLTDKINNGFYQFNLLSQMTLLAKNMESMFKGHTIIESALRLAYPDKYGKPKEWEIIFLARYNITPELAKRIADSPHQATKNSFILPNTTEWTDEAALTAFRSALRSNVMNRVIMGTPADKPYAMSGKTYMPIHIAKMMGLSESKRFKGYAEIESPYLALPFTFYTYTVGAFNKITTNYAQGLTRNPAAHFIVAMFLGYQVMNARTPNWAMEKMDAEDKVLRTFDYSGLAALYSDLVYRGLEMGMSFDISNPTPFEPRFTEDPDAIGGVVSIFGAPADYSYGFVKSLQNFARGNYEDGMEQAVSQVPLIGNFMIKEWTNDLKQALGDFAAGFE